MKHYLKRWLAVLVAVYKVLALLVTVFLVWREVRTVIREYFMPEDSSDGKFRE